MSGYILTHDAGEEHRPLASRWLAVVPDPEYCPAGADIGSLMASWCRVLEEAGRTGYGPTEEAAIAEVQRRFQDPTRPTPQSYRTKDF